MNPDDCYITAFKSGIKPEPYLTVDLWADQYRILPRKSSSEPGKWRTSRTPYLREIMECLSSSSDVEHIVVMKGTQLGFTEVGNNWFGYVAHINPWPMMMVFPTINLAKRHSKQKLAPTIESTPCLANVVSKQKSRNVNNTILAKDFLGGFIMLVGSESAADLRSASVKYLFLDDIDGYPEDVEGEGDPCGLAENRTDAFGGRKIYKVSTPTVKDKSRIETEFFNSDQRWYYIPCPLCNEMQILKWGNILFDHKDQQIIGDVLYACEYCGGMFPESHKTWMLENGKWIPSNPGHPRRGYNLSSLYSPLGWVSWHKIITEHLSIPTWDKSKRKRWANTRLAETWEEPGSSPKDDALYSRREDYGPEIPLEAGVLVCGVDVQDNRIECEVVAVGKGEETWGIEEKVLNGDPARLDVWQELALFLKTEYTHAAGHRMRVAATCIDTGGHHTQQTYNFVKPRERERIYGIKGANRPGEPIWPKRASRKNTGGINLYIIGTDGAKDYIYNRLRIVEPGPGFMHFPLQYDEEYFRQLTAEKVVYEKGVRKWINKHGVRNEALDRRVYAVAAIERLKQIPRFMVNLEKQIDKYLEAGVKVQDVAVIEQVAALPEQVTPVRDAVPQRKWTNPAGRGRGWMDWRK